MMYNHIYIICSIYINIRSKPRITGNKLFVKRRVEESWIGVSMHECVYLKLGFVECVWRWIDHVSVDDLANSRVERDLFGTEYGYVVFVDETGLLLYDLRILLFGFELFARHPEQHVLLAVFRAKKFTEVVAST
jgi:hypothetical protein